MGGYELGHFLATAVSDSGYECRFIRRSLGPARRWTLAEGVPMDGIDAIRDRPGPLCGSPVDDAFVIDHHENHLTQRLLSPKAPGKIQRIPGY
jgi:hypothetical protein